jgi:hypothetical protein
MPAAAKTFVLNQYVARDCADAGDAGKRHGHPHFRLYQLQHVRDARFAAASQREGPDAAEQNGARAQRQHADNIQPRTHAAIREHGQFAAYSINY